MNQRQPSPADFARVTRAVRIAAGASGAYIRINRRWVLAFECAKAVFEWLKEYAEREGIRIEVRRPDGMRVAVMSAGTAFVAAGAGMLLAGLPGAVIGLGVGAMAGYGLAHLCLVWDESNGTLLLGA